MRKNYVDIFTIFDDEEDNQHSEHTTEIERIKKKKIFINFILILLRRTNTVERGQRVAKMEKRRTVM